MVDRLRKKAEYVEKLLGQDSACVDFVVMFADMV